jgi:hypothetical protein
VQDGKPVITPAHLQQQFARHGLQLARYARSPSLCDRRACSSLDYVGGRIVFLATGAKTDFTVVVLPTLADARRIGALYRPGSAVAADRRQNLVLIYLRSAKARLAIVRRIFSSS